MATDKLHRHGSKSEWVAKLKGMSEEELFTHCEEYIRLSGYAANNPRSDYHFLCDAGYDECARRKRLDIYDLAWKKAVSSCG